MCACCGRIALTLLDEDPQRGNQFRLDLNRLGLKFELEKAPCVVALKTFLKTCNKLPGNDDDDMF